MGRDAGRGPTETSESGEGAISFTEFELCTCSTQRLEQVRLHLNNPVVVRQCLNNPVAVRMRLAIQPCGSKHHG